MDTKNYSRIRGGSNEYARFFLHITPEFRKNKEEMEAAFFLWNEEFGIRGTNWCGWCYPINNRREFALVPAIIRKAERLGYRVSTSMWDVGLEKQVYLDENPSEFWKALAMAQTYFE